MDCLDGFKQFNGKIDNALELNVSIYRNEVSPFSNILNVKSFSDKTIFVDSYYGLAYDSWINHEKVFPYGKLNEIPDFSGDQLSNIGFLRVPFRKIPRRFVKSRQELDFIVNSLYSADPNLKLYFRGQNNEYYLERSEETLEMLYSDENALEPSLLASSLRKGISLENRLPSWCAIIQLFIDTHIHEIRSWVSPSSLEEIKKELFDLITRSKFAYFAMALAQHYGLPSNGIDVTDRLEVALFFSLMSFCKKENSKNIYEYRYVPDRLKKPVIYLFSPSVNKQFDFESLRPRGLPLNRPDKQSAKFLHTGWGLNKNSCARYLFLAIYLDPDGDYGDIPDPQELFPSEDKFASFLKIVSDKNSLPKELKIFLDHLYFI